MTVNYEILKVVIVWQLSCDTVIVNWFSPYDIIGEQKIQFTSLLGRGTCSLPFGYATESQAVRSIVRVRD